MCGVPAVVLAVPSYGGCENEYIERSPFDRLVWYKLDGRDVRYSLLLE